MSASPAAFAASLTGHFHASLFHALPSALANNGAVGSLSFVAVSKTAAVAGGSLIFLSFPALSFPMVRVSKRLSKLPAVSAASAQTYFQGTGAETVSLSYFLSF